jgi:mRNA-degrading endonuclease RelE of RelBE toxin-antitoxin system
VGLSWRIEYLESVVQEDIPTLSEATRRRVRKAIESKLGSNPVEFGKPLRYSFEGARRLRVGDHRVIYRIEPPDVVLVVKIGHRRDVYDG